MFFSEIGVLVLGGLPFRLFYRKYHITQKVE